MSKKIVALQRKIARLAADWRDPHDEEVWAKRDIVKNIEITEDGEVTITLTPTRPHCPCCLLDLDNFRTKSYYRQKALVSLLLMSLGSLLVIAGI